MTTLAFWLDVDNTLLNNDGIKEDFNRQIQVELGPTLTQRFWDIYEQVREEKSVIDIPLALKLLREQTSLQELDEQTYERVHSIFFDYPFANALYPQVLATLQHLRQLGTTVIVSDGDPVFQARKIVNSELSAAVEGRVLLYIHKQEHLDEVMKLYPADHYVMIDDKPQILVDSKAIMGDRLTAVFVHQGKYADQQPAHFAPQITVEHIADLQQFTAERFLQQR